MNSSSVVLAALNLAAIGALPRIFFRRDGRLNIRWWLTAAPFFTSGALLALAIAGVIDDGTGTGLPAVRAGIAAGLHSASLALIALTVGSHRVPLSLWHQDNDAPQELVTWGPYRRVRHPFYAAFLLGLAGLCVSLPTPAVVAVTLYAAAALDVTARREERRLLESEFGADYRSYMATTGRLVPVLGRAA